jgi:hypothetical protein
MKRMRPRFYASLDGAKCASEGKKMDANPYHESDDLHFVWLNAWTNEKMDIKSRHNSFVEPNPS